MKSISLILAFFLGALPIATSMLQFSDNIKIVFSTIEEELSEEENEEKQEEKLTNKTKPLFEIVNLDVDQVIITLYNCILYNFQSYRGVITPPPEVI